MNNFFRALIAGYGAKKLGGGCFGTILVFVLIWVALGQCSFSSRSEVPAAQTFPAEYRVYAQPFPPQATPTRKGPVVRFEQLTITDEWIVGLSQLPACAA